MVSLGLFWVHIQLATANGFPGSYCITPLKMEAGASLAQQPFTWHVPVMLTLD